MYHHIRIYFIILFFIVCQYSFASAFASQYNTFQTQQSTSLGNPLIDAADVGDAQAVIIILRKGMFVDARGEFGVTALMRAAYRGNVELVQFLLAAGADPSMQDIGGATALHIAVREGNAEVVKALMESEKGQRVVELKDAEGYTPVMRAKNFENEEIKQSVGIPELQAESVAVPVLQAEEAKHEDIAKHEKEEEQEAVKEIESPQETSEQKAADEERYLHEYIITGVEAVWSKVKGAIAQPQLQDSQWNADEYQLEQMESQAYVHQQVKPQMALNHAKGPVKLCCTKTEVPVPDQNHIVTRDKPHKAAKKKVSEPIGQPKKKKISVTKAKRIGDG